MTVADLRSGGAASDSGLGREAPTQQQMVLDLVWAAGHVETWPRVFWPLADARNAVTLDVLDALLLRALARVARRDSVIRDSEGQSGASRGVAPGALDEDPKSSGSRRLEPIAFDESTLTTASPSSSVPWMFIYGRRETGIEVLIERVLAAGSSLGIEMGRWQRPDQACHDAPHGPAAMQAMAARSNDGWPDLLLVERVESRCDDPAEAEALFHALNEVRDLGVPMLLVADRPPEAIVCAFEDLRSRLAWGGVFAWRAPDDGALAQLVELEAARAGVDLQADVRDFLLTRGPRRPDAQLALFDALAEQALAEQRRLTEPFTRAWWRARDRAACADRQRTLFEPSG